MKFVIFKRRGIIAGWRWYFRLVAANGEIIAQSQGYKALQSCMETVELIRINSISAKVKVER